MLDVWVCSTCHSINRERSTTCYKCGSPRPRSTGVGEGLRPHRAIQARLVSGHKDTTTLAVLTAFLILVVVGLEIYITILGAPLYHSTSFQISGSSSPGRPPISANNETARLR
jgi:hypothetical protein